MSNTAADEVAEVMDRVKHWPSPTRIALARRILESLEIPAAGEPAPPTDRPVRGVPVDVVAGIFRTDRLPPTDEQCRQIVEEERWRKYAPPTPSEA